MRQGALFAVALAVVGAGIACAPTYPKCESDKACKEHNEVCVQGQCQECASDANCKTGFVCQASKCVPKPECDTDAACPSGLKCKSGKCAPECAQDSDCGVGKCVQNKCVENGCHANSDCPGGQNCEEGVCATPFTGSCDFKPVHFGFNDVNLEPQVRAQLNDDAQCFKAQHLARLLLEGHADERGTEEYNLQLSNRRAASVRKYLIDLGVPAAKLETAGFGANRPAVNGHNEKAWAANRRVEFKH